MANTNNPTKDMSPIGRALFESFAPSEHRGSFGWGDDKLTSCKTSSETDRLKAVIDRVVWEREALNTKVITMLGALEACKEFVDKEVERRSKDAPSLISDEAMELAGVISSAIESGGS